MKVNHQNYVVATLSPGKAHHTHHVGGWVTPNQYEHGDKEKNLYPYWQLYPNYPASYWQSYPNYPACHFIKISQLMHSVYTEHKLGIAHTSSYLLHLKYILPTSRDYIVLFSVGNCLYLLKNLNQFLHVRI
jgi:hypothetical protein